jgi:hypothetical protein
MIFHIGKKLFRQALKVHCTLLYQTTEIAFGCILLQTAGMSNINHPDEALGYPSVLELSLFAAVLIEQFR